MTLVLLVGVVVAGAVVAPLMMVRATWADSAPRTVIAWWYAQGVLLLISVLSLAVAVTVVPLQGNLVNRVVQFFGALMSPHPLRGLGLSEAVGLTLLTDLLILVLGGVVVGSVNSWRRRSRHHDLVDLVARRDEARNVYVIEHDRPAAYFVPGRGGRVVVSEGLFNGFEGDEVDAIVAHEHGHRVGHHGLWLAPLHTIRPFFSFVPFARFAPIAVKAAIEMIADDFAVAKVGLVPLTRALRDAHRFDVAPPGAVPWQGNVIERRTRRLESPLMSLRGALVAWLHLAATAAAIAVAWLSNG